LKNDAATSQIKVIAMTARAMKGDKERILRAGCDGYIAKPIRYKELLSILKIFLSDGRY
jgi:two-component system cell cycle response regulator DivK